MKKPMEFLMFKDWIEKKEHKIDDWIVVARMQKGEFGNLNTISVLASEGDGNLEKIISTVDWEIRLVGKPLEFGLPYFDLSNDRERVYHSAQSCKINGIEFRPFILYRTFRGYKPPVFEFVQNFLLFHKAFFVEEENEYHRVSDEGEIDIVARIINEGADSTSILVCSHHLRYYLAWNHSYLVRYHEHTRWLNQDITSRIKNGHQKHEIRDDTSFFDILIKTEPSDMYQCTSHLLGKDIVFPYSEPNKAHKDSRPWNEDTRYESYIINRSAEGEIVQVFCNDEKHRMKPVFFSKKVLTKYFKEPSRYQSSESYVSCLDIWELPIDINKERLVQVWLCDLSQIPYKEQVHWKQFNVPPRGKVTRERFLRDFMNIVEEPKDNIVQVFKRVFESIQAISITKFGQSMFKQLDDREEYLYASLHLPVSPDLNEFQEQVSALQKITNDSLNAKLLSKLSGKKISRDGPFYGPIDLLVAYLEEVGIKAEYTKRIRYGFKMLQQLRSKGVAHTIDSDFDKILVKYGLISKSIHDQVETVFHKIVESLRLLLEVLSDIK